MIVTVCQDKENMFQTKETLKFTSKITNWLFILIFLNFDFIFQNFYWFQIWDKFNTSYSKVLKKFIM
jgi:hypothetical protein